MNRFFRIFLYEVARNGRRAGYLFTTFGLPLLGVIGLLFYQTFATQPTESPEPGMNIPTFDLQGVTRGGYVDLTESFPDIDTGDVLTLYPDEAAAQAALEADTIQVYYIIPADYLETGNVTLVMSRLDISRLNPEPMRQVLLGTLAQGVDDPQLFERLVNPAVLEVINLEQTLPQDVAQTEGATFLLVYLFALTLVISLLVTNGYLLQSVIEEKETRLIEILVSSARPLELLSGKILAMGLLGLTQILVWVGVLLAATRLSNIMGIGDALALVTSLYVPVEILPLLLVYFVLAYLMYAAAFAMVGAISNSMREGPQYAAVFTLPAVAPMWFLGIFATTPNAPLPVFLSLFPLTAPVAMTQRLVIASVPAWQIAISLTLLALTVAGMMWLAARVFRVGVLLAGQPPRLRDLPALLRG
jgi:ABC-2 type transport system permease protein